MYSRTLFRLALPTFLLSLYHPLATSLLHITARTPIAPGTELRILPLGDSITYGWNSTAGTDGYRLKLSTDLSGSDLLFIGTQRSGSMSDNHNEGHPGFTISRIAAVAGPALAMRPNIILLHAGTNDLHNRPPPANESYADAPARLGALVDELVERCPGAVVLVAQIISVASASAEARIRAFNEAVPGVVRERVERGGKVAVVDMSGVGVGELVDGSHP
ncbi:carbohydrate esterase family 3 protein [Cenococcum geophilum 1.58]|uniref:Carbohydrate esterase family 3 protein n=1 Tax=Cenococcum geophilum 1.58 TaxID=794803 RepID=A0ACC8EPW6_9PEZI|nr:carbohydrate esterase family 3 protein [Cenococcum geophilum 1.58]